MPGLGAGRVQSSWSVRDASGEQVGACEIDGSVYAGVLGGSFRQVLRMTARRFATFLDGPQDEARTADTRPSLPSQTAGSPVAP